MSKFLTGSHVNAKMPHKSAAFVLKLHCAERTRFELVVPIAQYVGLANRWFQPLTHLSNHTHLVTKWDCKYITFFLNLKLIIYICSPNAEIAQLVERNLAKVEVAGPSPVFRSKAKRTAVKVVLFGLNSTTFLPATSIRASARTAVRVCLRSKSYGRLAAGTETSLASP